MKLTTGILPYADGSGHQITATVQETDTGLTLRIEMVGGIDIDDWSSARMVIDAMVKSACEIKDAAGGHSR